MQTIPTLSSARDAVSMPPQQEPAEQRAVRVTTVGDVLSWSVAALLMGAAGIHFAVMGEHAGVSWTHGTFFAVVAWLQIALGVAIAWRRSRAVAVAVIALNVAVLGVWVLSRTVGLAVGGDGTPEAWGRTDVLCAVLEGLAIVGSVGLLIPRLARRPVSAGVGFGAAAFVAIVIASVVTLVFSPAWAGGEAGDGHGHAHGGGAEPPGAAQPAAAAPGAHTHSHGATTLNGQKISGIKAQDIAAEAQPDQPLDAATRATLRSELLAARELTNRYPTVADVTAAGYVLAGGFAPGSGAHYIGPGGLTGPGPFDSGKALSLIYAGTEPSSEVIGIMYYGLGEEAPEGFAGPNDHWHRHSNVCMKNGPGGMEFPYPADMDVTRAQCEAAGGGLMKMTGWMVHAWVVPTWESPQGVFSHDNTNVRCADGTYDTDKAGFCAGV